MHSATSGVSKHLNVSVYLLNKVSPQEGQSLLFQAVLFSFVFFSLPSWWIQVDRPSVSQGKVSVDPIITLIYRNIKMPECRLHSCLWVMSEIMKHPQKSTYQGHLFRSGVLSLIHFNITTNLCKAVSHHRIINFLHAIFFSCLIIFGMTLYWTIEKYSDWGWAVVVLYARSEVLLHRKGSLVEDITPE